MRLKPLPLRKIVSILRYNGWEFDSQKGDHVKYRKKNRVTPVGFSAHLEITVAQIKMIMNQSGKLREQFANA